MISVFTLQHPKSVDSLPPSNCPHPHLRIFQILHGQATAIHLQSWKYVARDLQTVSVYRGDWKGKVSDLGKVC